MFIDVGVVKDWPCALVGMQWTRPETNWQAICLIWQSSTPTAWFYMTSSWPRRALAVVTSRRRDVIDDAGMTLHSGERSCRPIRSACHWSPPIDQTSPRLASRRPGSVDTVWNRTTPWHCLVYVKPSRSVRTSSLRICNQATAACRVRFMRNFVRLWSEDSHVAEQSHCHHQLSK